MNIIHTIKTPHALIVSSAILFTCPDAHSATVSLAADFSETQGDSGLFYEAYPDNRPTNTTNPGTGAPTLLTFVGGQSFPNGSIVNTGPAYLFSGQLPWVLQDITRDTFLMHPGTGGTEPGNTTNQAASVRLITAGGLYHISGAFARANDFQLAGDGVEVGIFRDTAASTPLFSSTISANHTVDPNDYFGGTGVSTFDLTVTLAPNEALRFAVFSGPQGTDGTFDATAFRFSAQAVPEPTSALLLLSSAVLCLRFRSHRRHEQDG